MDLSTTYKFILSTVLTFSGIYFFIFNSVKRLMERRKVKVQGETTQATIVDVAKSKDSDGVIYYYPVIRFRAANGQVVTVQSEDASTIKKTIGKKLKIRYLPSNPEQFVITKTFPIVDAVSIVAGFVCIALSWYVLAEEFS